MLPFALEEYIVHLSIQVYVLAHVASMAFFSLLQLLKTYQDPEEDETCWILLYLLKNN